MFRVSSKFYNIPHQVLDLVEAAREGHNIVFESACCQVQMDYVPTEKEMAAIEISKPCELMSQEFSTDEMKAKSRHLFFSKKYVTRLVEAHYEINLNLRNHPQVPIKIEIKTINYDAYCNDGYEKMDKKSQKKWVKAHADRSHRNLMLI